MSIVLASQAIVDVIAKNNFRDCLEAVGEPALVSTFSSRPHATSLAFTIFFPSEGFSVTTRRILMVDCPSCGIPS